MNNSKLTKIVCGHVDDKFVVLYLRWRKISKLELKLKPSKGECLKITDPVIKSSIISFYDEFKQSGLDLVEYFEINIVYGVERRSRNNHYEFNLRETIFDQSKKVWCVYYGK